MARGDVKAAIKDWYLNGDDRGAAHVMLKLQWELRDRFSRDEVREAMLELLEYGVLETTRHGGGDTRRFRLSREFAREMSRTTAAWRWTMSEAT